VSILFLNKSKKVWRGVETPRRLKWIIDLLAILATAWGYKGQGFFNLVKRILAEAVAPPFFKAKPFSQINEETAWCDLSGNRVEVAFFNFNFVYFFAILQFVKLFGVAVRHVSG
tara:strand:- start:936 stop:1277 length:342 start_codon:yes stop_codon:yes gene_type:complete